MTQTEKDLKEIEIFVTELKEQGKKALTMLGIPPKNGICTFTLLTEKEGSYLPAAIPVPQIPGVDLIVQNNFIEEIEESGSRVVVSCLIEFDYTQNKFLLSIKSKEESNEVYVGIDNTPERISDLLPISLN